MHGTTGTLSGTFAGRYSIEYELGHGATATVYLARDNQRNRKVAIKILRPELAQSVGAERFLREIRVNEQLSHPHIVPVLDSGEWEGQLYFVLPHMEGGSLRTRMQRDKQLRIEEAVAIARTIAGALDYAHQRGLIHRDVKPENILFTGGQACLADFGIARAIERTIDESTTSTGLVRGTPAYMSPEQASGSKQYDGRSDIYSLGCVLYETIAGIPAFIGPTPEAVIAQRFHYEPRELRVYRQSVPPALEAAIHKALAMTAADRYATAGEFAAALETAQRVSRIEPRTSGPTIGSGRAKRVTAVGSVLLLVTIVALATLASGGWSAIRDGLFSLGLRSLDSSRVFVAPLQSDSATRPVADEAESRLRTEIDQWSGLRLANAPESDDPKDAGGLTHEAAVRAARASGSRRVVWGIARQQGERTRVDLQMLDARDASATARAAVVLASAGDPDIASLIAKAVAALIGGIEAPPSALRAAGGTRSLAAWSAYVRGHRALNEWRLAAAESAFAAAADADARFGAARTWLGQTMVWNRHGARSDWRRHAEDALVLGQLHADDLAIAQAIAALGQREDPRACESYARLLARDSANAVAWLGLGDCQALDSIVVRDARSPSGYAFRGNLTRALAAYERAVGLQPGAYAALPYSYIERQLLLPRSHLYKRGIGGDDAQRSFGARPVAAGSAVAYVPRLITGGSLGPDPPGFEEGLRRNRTRLFDYVSTWTRRAPSSEAYEALSSVQESRAELLGAAARGTLSAMGALDSALRMTSNAEARARIGASRVRVLLKGGEFARARLVADSLLARADAATAREAHWLGGIAAVTGRLQTAARLARLGQTPPVNWDTLPPALADPATLLLLRAAAGVCDRPLLSSFEALSSQIDSYVAPAHRPVVTAALMDKARYLAVPCTGLKPISGLQPTSIWDRMSQRFARGDRAGALAALDTVVSSRRNRPPGGTALDFVVREAWVLAATGDTVAAMRHLDRTLSALPTLSDVALYELAQAATLGRAMAWRADLARATNDAQNARRWAAAAHALWRNADGELQPVVKRMEEIAGSG